MTSLPVPVPSMALPLCFLLFLSTASVNGNGIPIFHSQLTSPPSSSSPLDSILNLARNDPDRLAFLSQKITSVPVASGQQIMQSSSYVISAKLGSPGQNLLLALDTSADAAFVPCRPCSTCPSTSPPLFRPADSATYSTIPCSSSWCPQFKGKPCATLAQPSPCYYTQYLGGDSSTFSAALSEDSLVLANDVIPNYVFGCVNAVNGTAANMPKQGLLGLGRGSMSLVSQTGSVYKGIFSYCLPSFKSFYFSGSLLLGPAGQPRAIPFTPLLTNPHRPSLYYVNLTSISVGQVQVAVPPGSLGFDPQTGAGTVVDSGTVITRFAGPAYAAIRDEFRRQVAAPAGYTSLGAFDTCFDASDASAVTTPAVTLHMDGGLDLRLPVENTLIHSSATPLACLAMAAAPPNVNSVVNVIANLQQQNLRVLVDVPNSRVGFARELCN